ncbi:MAG: metal ABC transporter permease [Aerococcaceae bacterium]|nr:metal ABC transporter permease [Aerococcaceae bacterium]
MIESLWIMLLVGISCSLIGSLLLLKQSVMVADAISHTVLLGSVLVFFIVPDLNSPWLLVGATLFGVLTVVLIEALVKTHRIQNDAAIGLVFPAFFAITVILITKYFKNVHLDTDMVLMGNIIFAPLNRMTIGTLRIPKALLQSGLLLLINLTFISATYQSLKIRLFDETFAKTIGIRVALLDLALMTLVSLTSVISFQSVGSILVIALMIAPAMSARLLAKSFPQLLCFATLIASFNCAISYMLAIWLNVSMSGMVATVSFLVFVLIFSLKKN